MPQQESKQDAELKGTQEAESLDQISQWIGEPSNGNMSQLFSSIIVEQPQQKGPRHKESAFAEEQASQQHGGTPASCNSDVSLTSIMDLLQPFASHSAATARPVSPVITSREDMLLGHLVGVRIR